MLPFPSRIFSTAFFVDESALRYAVRSFFSAAVSLTVSEDDEEVFFPEDEDAFAEDVFAEDVFAEDVFADEVFAEDVFADEVFDEDALADDADVDFPATSYAFKSEVCVTPSTFARFLMTAWEGTFSPRSIFPISAAERPSTLAASAACDRPASVLASLTRVPSFLAMVFLQYSFDMKQTKQLLKTSP